MDGGLARPPTEVADALVEVRRDIQLTDLERRILPQGEPEAAGHLNLSQTKPFAVGGQSG